MKKKLIAGALIVVAIALIFVGVLDGGAKDVFSKAAHICFECIGIG